MRVRAVGLPSGVIACAALAGACSSATPDGPIGEAESALACPVKGKQLFDNALPGTNGRSCATCHVPDKNFALHPDDVKERFQNDPNDPLFNVLDADDPTASTPTYEHLKAGFIRVTLNLADNLDVVDDSGHVITNAARTIFVWRGVPTVENTAYTAPYQYDGRFATLQEQANGALLAHSQMNPPPTTVELDDIAAYEQTVFSDNAAQQIADAIENGQTPPSGIGSLTTQQAQGEALFQKACAACHGDPTQIANTNEAVHDQLFPVLNCDGTVSVFFPSNEQGIPLAKQIHHNMQGHREMNIGIAFGTVLGLTGKVPVPQSQRDSSGNPLSFPQYRIRFYTDGTRTKKVFDLPPLPSEGAGPTLFPQPYSVDPGLAVVTGDPLYWEAFDTPQLRGIKNTAPYFHDNSAPDLLSVLDIYSRFILPELPELGFLNTLPSEGPGLPPESLSPAQKAAIVAFLETL